ncbi:sporulation protein YunB [Bacillus sp. T33-2]|uniref:sporulation protein YunB n=1 Tax=Bacillus sp. T33-2 TaxID=2054168 RepID=UPI000C785513|nr:sporulation protein YunB [Bacillus sp. T33-2]PLR92613.1 sporulation protein YunB [Bacillus sp. T33-2]
MAKFRGRMPRRGPLPFRYVLLLTFVFFLFSTAAGLWIINEGIKPTLMSYAKSQTGNIATLVINSAIDNDEISNMDINDVLEIQTNQQGRTSVKLNAQKVNQVRAEVTKLVQKNLVKAERGQLEALELEHSVDFETEEMIEGDGIVFYVPLGQATNNVLLGNLGPEIPIKFTAIGEVDADVKLKTDDPGVNNISVEAWIELEVNVQIIIPFATGITTIKDEIPLGAIVFEGEVPLYYNGAGDSAPSIQLPGE